ncbi:MAG TPA: Bax inhibitor-1/YccA family protein, partial [Phycisphaerales bacterium]|nr:Bax inhibitor-1/YccA family protein [Phycisphaerales bacterium]
CGYALAVKYPATLFISWLTSFVVSLTLAFLLYGKPAWSVVLAPVFAVVEGTFLGAFTALADQILAQNKLSVMGGVGIQAFVVTSACALSVLGLYRMGWIKPTRGLAAVVRAGILALFVTYMISFALSFFGVHMPFVTFYSAVTAKGTMGFIGLGVNLLILGLASLTLVMDLGMVEQNVSNRAPKYMEWYCAYALLVTLAWIYYEAVKLVVRVAILFGNRK